MSNPEQDPSEFDKIIHGETASAGDIAAMEALATDFVQSMPTETIKDVLYTDEETGASFALATTYHEDIDATNTFVAIHLGYAEKEEWSFSISFDPHNALHTIYYPDEKDIVDALKASKELSASDLLDPKTSSILEHLGNILKHLGGELSLEKLASLSALSSDQQRHAAEVAREAVNEQTNGQSVQIRERIAVVSDTVQLTVRHYQPLGYSAAELEERELPLLEAVLEDQSNGLRYCYTKTITDAQLEVIQDEDDRAEAAIQTGEDPEITVPPDDFWVFYAELHTNTPSRDDIARFTDALISVTLSTMEDDPDVSETTYPELDFGFNTSQFLDGEDINIISVTREALRTLEDTCRYELPELCPDGYPPQPTYRFSTKQRQRIDNFLHQRVSSVQGGQDSRGNIFDIHIACEQILDELSEQNHPLAQMIAQLNLDYGDLIGSAEMQVVTTEVIKQTQDRRLRNFYREKVTAWRVGELAIA